MNAPGRVTRPVVRTWSRPGSSASGDRRWMISPMACDGSSPSDRQAWYWVCSSRRAAKLRRPASVWAVIALPTMIPAIGMSAMPSAGTAPLSRTMASTGNEPAPTATATQIQAPGASTRRAGGEDGDGEHHDDERGRHHRSSTTARMTSAMSGELHQSADGRDQHRAVQAVAARPGALPGRARAGPRARTRRASPVRSSRAHASGELPLGGVRPWPRPPARCRSGR